MLGISLKNLDLDTLVFCQTLAWQAEKAFSIGRDNPERRAIRKAYASMQHTIDIYIKKAEQAKGE